MIDVAIRIGYISIAILVVANLYYTVRIADRKYNFLSVFNRFKRGRKEKVITWGRR